MTIKKHIELIESLSTGKESYVESGDRDAKLSLYTAEELAKRIIVRAREKADNAYKRSGEDTIDHEGTYAENIKHVGKITVRVLRVPTLNPDGTVKKVQYRTTIKLWRQPIPKKELISIIQDAKDKELGE